jgi:hypothetical protein
MVRMIFDKTGPLKLPRTRRIGGVAAPLKKLVIRGRQW